MNLLLQHTIIMKSSHDKKAIELLTGDKLIPDYFDNKSNWKEVRSKLQDEESVWIKEAFSFLIYKSSLQQLKLK